MDAQALQSAIAAFSLGSSVPSSLFQKRQVFASVVIVDGQESILAGLKAVALRLIYIGSFRLPESIRIKRQAGTYS